jgi:hypothetical protein
VSAVAIVLIVAAYLASFVFTLSWCARQWLNEFGEVTRGDLALFAFMALIPGMGAILWILESTHGFWSKQVWPK